MATLLSPSILLGIVPQPTDSRLSETKCSQIQSLRWVLGSFSALRRCVGSVIRQRCACVTRRLRAFAFTASGHCAHQTAVRDHETAVNVAHTAVLDLHQMAESVRRMAVDLPEYT